MSNPRSPLTSKAHREQGQVNYVPRNRVESLFEINFKKEATFIPFLWKSITLEAIRKLSRIRLPKTKAL